MAVELKPHERLWLEEVRNRLVSGKPIDYPEMMVELRDTLPAGFTPNQIDPEYLQGSQLTVAALHALDPHAQELKDLERLIFKIQEWVIESPHTQEVSADECATALDAPEIYVARLLALAGTLGFFWGSASGTPDNTGFSRVNISSLDALATYLKFTSIENSLLDRTRERQTTRFSSGPLGSRGVAMFPTLSNFEHEPPPPVTMNAAFIMMSMDASDPGLEDVSNGIKDVCSLFGVTAKRSTDVEHSEKITDLILHMIRTSDILIGDVTGERPNVYYEIGYAHALNKKPLLYRRAGTRLHFDLSVHNIPEYTNVSDLKSKLKHRLEAVLGRSPKLTQQQ